MLKAAVIGLGSIAPIHIAAIQSSTGARLVAGCDIDSSRRVLLPPNTRFYIDYEEMLAKEKPNVVHICLPHHLHYPAALACAQRGVNVFLEKPPAHTCRLAQQLCAFEEQYNVQICVCLQNRYNASSQALKARLQSGQAGKVTGLRGQMYWQRTEAYYNAAPWRGVLAQAGGGCLINQALHTLDLLLWFAGAPLAGVSALAGNLLGYGLDVEDSLMARLTFKNGATGLFAATVADFEDANVQIEVACENARFLIGDKALYQKTADGLVKLAADDLDAMGKACYGNSHSLLIGHFYTALANRAAAAKGNAAPPHASKPAGFPHPQDALPVMEALDKIYTLGGVYPG